MRRLWNAYEAPRRRLRGRAPPARRLRGAYGTPMEAGFEPTLLRQAQ